MITEAFPEDSGLFKCVALNSFGTVSCSAVLQVCDGLTLTSLACSPPSSCSEGGGSLTFDLPCLDHADLEEQEMDAVGLQGAAESSLRQQVEDFPSELPDSVTLPPPDWPESLPEDDAPGAE